MSGKITRTTGPTKYVEQQKLRAEIKQLEKAVDKLLPAEQSDSPELAELSGKLGRLHKNRTLFWNSYASDRILREDATLQSRYGQQAFEPAEGFLDTELTEAAALGWYVCVLTGTPEHPGLRFHTPVWVKDWDLFAKFGRRLASARKKEFPTLAEFQQSKSETDVAILWDYYVDHISFQEIFAKYSRSETDDAYGVYDVRVEDAKDSIAGAIEFSAQKNGTYSSDEGNDCYTFFDQVKRGFRKVTARKINDKLFRVDFRVQSDDRYFLPEKLDPSKKDSTRPLQEYIADLVDQGYLLLKIAKPTDSDRKVARLQREAEQEQVIARAQLSGGTDPKVWESAPADQSSKLSPERLIKIECGRIAAFEKRLEVEAETKATAALDPFQLWRHEQERGEKAYQKLLAATKVTEAVAKATCLWQLPVELKPEPEPEPMVTPAPAQAPAVRHEVLRMSILLLLAAMVQGQPTPQFQGARL